MSLRDLSFGRQRVTSQNSTAEISCGNSRYIRRFDRCDIYFLIQRNSYSCKQPRVICEDKRHNGFLIKDELLLKPITITEPSWFICQDKGASLLAPNI